MVTQQIIRKGKGKKKEKSKDTIAKCSVIVVLRREVSFLFPIALKSRNIMNV